MAKQMTDDEYEAAVKDAEKVDEFDYRNDNDQDDYYSLILYRAKDGQQFRSLEESGMNSKFDGAMRQGTWLTKSEAKSWTEL